MNSKAGRELLEVIESFAELAWAKYQARNPTFFVAGRAPWTEDRSQDVPYTSYRFKHENSGLEERIRDAVESYSGAMEWRVESHERIGFSGSRNWVISPSLDTGEIKSSEEKKENATEKSLVTRKGGFAEIAYEDLIALAAHVREVLEKK